MKVAYMQLGSYMTNCYFLTDEETKATAIIDPGDWAGEVVSYVEKEGLDVKYILLTHGHFDHTGAVPEVHKATGAPVYMSEKDLYVYEQRPAELEINYYDEGSELTLGSLTIKVLSTPGHTPGSVTLLVGDKMFSGDTLFFGSCGRTDFPGGSYEQILRSLKRLALLEGEYDVLPGHDRASKLSIERKFNPYMRGAMDLE